MAQKLTFKAIDFDGEPTMIDFFFNQIRTLASIHKWKDNETIQFLGGKLTGAARTYFTQNPDLFKADNLDFVEKEFRTFFAPISKTTALIEFNNLTLLPQETIRNLAHRLNVLTNRVYDNISDKNALDNIKFTKFVSIIPSNLRIKIQEEEINNYSNAVERSQTLQDISQNEKILQTCPNTTGADSITKQLHELSEKINALSFVSQTKDCNNVKDNMHERDYDIKNRSPHNYRSNPRNFKTRFNNNRNNTNSFSARNKNRNSPVICQLCSKRNHTADKCFKWTTLNVNRGNSNNRNAKYGKKFNDRHDNLN